MIGFEQTEWIARSPQAVFDFLAEAANAPKVMPTIKQIVKLTPGPVAVGARYRETRVMNGKEAQAELEIARYEPPQHYAMRNVTDGVETIYHYAFSPEREGARVTLRCEINASGLKKLVLPMVATVLKKEDADHLARLKAAVEAA